MMPFIDMLLLAVAVAMDCFTMAIASGIIIKKFQWRTALSMAFFFGLFQMAMPLLGWFAINSFAHYVEAFDHWIAFGLLAFLGGRMIRDAYLPEEQRKMNPCELKNQLILGVATSIDALAIGISFACMGYHHVTTLTQPLLLIGGVTFVLTLWGMKLGTRLGAPIERKLKPALLGGVILIAIGIKVLITHLTA